MVEGAGDRQPEQNGGSLEMDPGGEADREQSDIYGFSEKLWNEPR